MKTSEDSSKLSAGMLPEKIPRTSSYLYLTGTEFAYLDKLIAERESNSRPLEDYRVALTQAKESKCPPSKLAEFFDYDPLSGEFSWAVAGVGRGRGPLGGLAGTTNQRGYVVITLDGLHLLAHRVAWAITTGNWPKHQIDHIDMCRSNNRLANLREATNRSNHANRSDNNSGTVGVMFEKGRGKWKAYIRVGYTMHNIGRFATQEEAVLARSTYMQRLIHLGYLKD